MRILLWAGLLLFAVSCAPTRGTSGAADNSTGTVREVGKDARDLTDYLRTVSGVAVRGSGPSATITIRGINSIELSTEPLFLVDGTVAGRGLASVYDGVNIQDVKRIRVLKTASETVERGFGSRIRVLKTASETALYGSRGSNGVILIETN